MRSGAGGLSIAIDPNSSSRLWPGHVSAYRPAGTLLRLGDIVRVVQQEADEADFVGSATVIGMRGRFVGLEVDWDSFKEVDDTSTQRSVEPAAQMSLVGRSQDEHPLTISWGGSDSSRWSP